MAGFGEFTAAFAAFLLSHALPVRPAVRGRLAARLGEGGFLLLYSLVSLAALAWLVGAAGRAPYLPIWDPAPWQRWAPNLAMPAACLLAAYALGAPNPLSFGGTAAGFDPARPGIAGVSRHPLLLAIALWAATHAVANGDLAHLLLFGSFGAFALLGMAMIDRRQRRRRGEAAWQRLAANTSLWPFAALIEGHWRPQGAPSLWRLGAGVALWAVLLHAHAAVIGVSPLP